MSEAKRLRLLAILAVVALLFVPLMGAAVPCDAGARCHQASSASGVVLTSKVSSGQSAAMGLVPSPACQIMAGSTCGLALAIPPVPALSLDLAQSSLLTGPPFQHQSLSPPQLEQPPRS